MSLELKKWKWIESWLFVWITFATWQWLCFSFIKYIRQLITFKSDPKCSYSCKYSIVRFSTRPSFRSNYPNLEREREAHGECVLERERGAQCSVSTLVSCRSQILRFHSLPSTDNSFVYIIPPTWFSSLSLSVDLFNFPSLYFSLFIHLKD